jgi:hypothetical protein
MNVVRPWGVMRVHLRVNLLPLGFLFFWDHFWHVHYSVSWVRQHEFGQKDLTQSTRQKAWRKVTLSLGVKSQVWVCYNLQVNEYFREPD